MLHFERYDSFFRCRAMMHTLARKVKCHAVLRYHLLVSAQRKSQCVCFGTFYIWRCHYVLFHLIQMYWSVSCWMEISTTSVAPKQASTLPNSKHEWHMKHSIVISQITVCCNKQWRYFFKASKCLTPFMIQI